MVRKDKVNIQNPGSFVIETLGNLGHLGDDTRPGYGRKVNSRQKTYGSEIVPLILRNTEVKSYS